MVSETIIHFPGYNLFFHEFHEMAVAYENEDFVLSAEHAEHINERHVDREKAPRANKFYRKFNLTATLGLLTRKTWEERDDFVIIESGFKTGHGEYFMYVFEMGKNIGTDPWAYASRKICIYYSYNPKIANKFRIISAYPFSWRYHNFLKQRKLGLPTY